MYRTLLFIVFISLCAAASDSQLTCGPNEVIVQCQSECASDYCPKYKNEDQSCPTPDPCPADSCKCQFNYRRAENGTCISTRLCPEVECGEHETYNTCPPLCPTDDCSYAPFKGSCPPLFGRIGIVLDCNPKCRCSTGYWRQNGVCIPAAECPSMQKTSS